MNKLKNIKLTGTSWLLIAAGVFIIATATLATFYFQQSKQADELAAELNRLETTLQGIQIATLTAREADLNNQLAEITAQLDTAESLISQPITGAEVTSTLFNIAKDYDLEVVEITASVPTIEDLFGVSCSVITLQACVEGDGENMVSFVTDLNNHFKTGVIRSVNITLPEITSGEKASVNVTLIVYSYQGG